jgi:thiamine-monophosphate kinase
MNEYELIRRIATRLPRAADSGVGPFVCDAELVRIGGAWWGVTADEFTPEEDLFTADDPDRLGWNLVVATVSDLLAAGVRPAFFLNTLAVPRDVNEAFLDGLAAGMARALSACGCGHCGGDLGTAERWRFTGIAMGPAAGTGALTHRFSRGPLSLHVTGTLGDLNQAAVSGVTTPMLELRRAEAEAFWPHAVCGMDTSGGLLDALWVLHEQNPGWTLDVDMDAIPYAAPLRQYAAATGSPVEAGLVGGAGEYELLFAVPESLPGAKRRELEGVQAPRIGGAREGGGGVFLHRRGRPPRRLDRPPPCPREAHSLDEHVQAVFRMAREIAS